MIDALVASSADGDLQTKLHDRSKGLCENGRQIPSAPGARPTLFL